MVETHLLTRAYCLYLIDVEWRVLFKMAVICQVLIIQSHKHKHRVMNLEESTHFHNRLCKMPLTRRGVFTPKFLFTSSLDNYSCSQHLWQSQEQLTLKQLQRAMDTKWLYQQLHKHGKSPELISHDRGQRSFYHALLLKGGCTVEHIGALAFLWIV